MDENTLEGSIGRIRTHNRALSTDEINAKFRLETGELTDTCPNCSINPDWNCSISYVNSSVEHHSIACDNCGYDLAHTFPVASREFLLDCTSE